MLMLRHEENPGHIVEGRCVWYAVTIIIIRQQGVLITALIGTQVDHSPWGQVFWQAGPTTLHHQLLVTDHPGNES